MIGERIKQARGDMGITQSELARRAGISKSHLSSVENGDRTGIGADTLRVLCQALSVSADWLLEIQDVDAGGDDRVAALCREVAELREWKRRVTAVVNRKETTDVRK